MGIMDFFRGKKGKSTMTPIDLLKEKANAGSGECNCAECQAENTQNNNVVAKDEITM